MPDYVETACELATQAHAGQRRWGGEDFITHPEAVAGMVQHLGPEYAAAAWLHDVLEDTEVMVGELRAMTLDGRLPAFVVEAVEYLTRPEGCTYLDYILVVSQNRIARAVKLADLSHNLSTSDPVRNRNVRDKWLLAKYVLENLNTEGTKHG